MTDISIGSTDYDKVEVYQTKSLHPTEKWAWRRTAANGKKLSRSSEGYRDKSQAVEMCLRCNPDRSLASLVVEGGIDDVDLPELPDVPTLPDVDLGVWEPQSMDSEDMLLKYTAAFTEWDRRYRAEPDSFWNAVKHLVIETPHSYGEACAQYFAGILRSQQPA